MSANPSKKTPRPLTQDCQHCDGTGQVKLHCNDCGEDLTNETMAPTDRELNPDFDDLCKECLANRKEDD